MLVDKCGSTDKLADKYHQQQAVCRLRTLINALRAAGERSLTRARTTILERFGAASPIFNAMPLHVIKDVRLQSDGPLDRHRQPDCRTLLGPD